MYFRVQQLLGINTRETLVYKECLYIRMFFGALHLISKCGNTLNVYKQNINRLTNCDIFI